MFENLPLAPPDPILGLTESYRNDTRPHKINLGVGVFQDATGRTPVLGCVREAERRILERGDSKSYLPIPGSTAFGARTRELLFGPEHPVLGAHRARTAQTPGGTGALRVAADFIHAHLPGAAVWLSSPTWANHHAVFRAAGVPLRTYPYYDAATRGLAFDVFLDSLRGAAAGDVVLLHACCHNPSGVDPSPEQWQQLAGLLRERGLLPLVDFAYQGFGAGLEEDALAPRLLARECPELLICSSYSKNFGLYNERVGAFTAVAAGPDETERLFSNVKPLIRANYSNPPAHGGAIVTTVLEDPELRRSWQVEVAVMRDRINGVRRKLADTLASRVPGRDFSFILAQKGMFSFSGLAREEVQRLREEYGIYIVDSGRINVAGITDANLEYLCDAIAAVG